MKHLITLLPLVICTVPDGYAKIPALVVTPELTKDLGHFRQTRQRLLDALTFPENSEGQPLGPAVAFEAAAVAKFVEVRRALTDKKIAQNPEFAAKTRTAFNLDREFVEVEGLMRGMEENFQVWDGQAWRKGGQGDLKRRTTDGRSLEGVSPWLLCIPVATCLGFITAAAIYFRIPKNRHLKN